MLDLPGERLRSHRLSAPAASIAAAAAHMLAVQAQDFAGGRWALTVRTGRAPGLSDVDAAFGRGEIVRSWTQRGTLHIVPASDLRWMLGVTGERQLRQAAPRNRQLGIDDDVLGRCERAIRAVLRGGGRATRAELFDAMRGAGVDPAAQRGVHVLADLSLSGVLVQGPVVPRANGPSREQCFVLAEEWLPDAAAPADPLGEMFARYVDGHGPASAADFAWWSGLPLGVARDAAERASGRLREVAEGVFVGRPRPRRRSDAAAVVALPPFDEYYISYADRTGVCAPELLDAVGPGKNGMVRAVLVAGGTVVGTWTHSLAVGRHDGDPVPDSLVAGASDADVAAALERYRRFVAG